MLCLSATEGTSESRRLLSDTLLHKKGGFDGSQTSRVALLAAPSLSSTLHWMRGKRPQLFAVILQKAQENTREKKKRKATTTTMTTTEIGAAAATTT